jgi:hypothetical protein
MKRLMIGLMATMSLIACARGGSPEAVVEEVMRAGETGRCDNLAENFTATSRQMIGEKLKQSCLESKGKEKAGNKTLKTLKVVDRQEQGDRATVRLEPEFSDGSKQPAQTFVLMREDNRWRIDLLATAAANGKNDSGAGPGGPGGMPSPTPAPPAAAAPPAGAEPATNAATGPDEEAGDEGNESTEQ